MKEKLPKPEIVSPLHLLPPEVADKIATEAASVRRKADTMRKTALIDELVSLWMESQALRWRGDYYRKPATKANCDRKKGADTVNAEGQAAKQAIRGEWDRWQQGAPGGGRYRSNAEFARDMLNKQDAITNPKTIETWCTAWRKERR